MPSPATPCPGVPGPPRRSRDDACPGALRLHIADDGALARIRLPGGFLTSRQAHCLASIAEDLGNGELELTSRGNVQVRELPGDCGRQLADRLRPVGLLPSDTHERVRNVVVSPLTGLDGRGCADVGGWVRELDALLCANPGAAALSGRFLFAVDDGRGDAAALGADVTIIATPGGGAELRTGAGGPRLRVAAEDAARAAVTAAEAFLHAAAESGTRAWRVRDLPRRGAGPGAGETGESGGPAESGERTEPPSASSASSGAPGRPALDEALLGRHLSRAGVAWTPAEQPPPDPGPREGDSPAPGPAPGLIRAPGSGGRCALSVSAPLGRYTAAQWRLLAETADRSGDAEIRTTPWRGVVVPGLSRDAGPAALRRLAGAGLVTAPGSPWYAIGSCTGRPGCAKSLADVRTDAARAVGTGPAERAAVPGGPSAAPATDGPARAPRPAAPAAPAVPAPGTTAGTAGVPVPPTGASGLPVDASAAPAGTAESDDGTAAPPPVYWSGCERRCGRPGGGAWIDVLATGDGAYRVAVSGALPEGRTAPRPVRVPPGRTAAAIAAARAASTADAGHPAHATGAADGTSAAPGGAEGTAGPRGEDRPQQPGHPGTPDGTGGPDGTTRARTP
ncbi:nitrite reductase [Streptomyces sp. MNU89]|uniref:nitrite reductase n=1 Tax=Streptomyces sp. MNU89 TaxID=2560025 RepID=UPI001E53B1E2|nr:nitrite reductase [Streptomyces sp. MNU89]MCC9738206.1 nitrite reductase [Streptomyces sp. MNU89]